MASNINPALPADGVPAVKSQLRANLSTAKSEIEALQSGLAAVPPAAFTGMRNRIINGDFRIVARNNTPLTIVNNDAAGFCADRWYGRIAAGGGGFTMTPTIDLTMPTPYYSYMRIAVSTAKGTLANADVHRFAQVIESVYNMDWRWGTASAKPIAVSLRVRGSIAGAYAVYVQASTLSYVASFTINLANTWEDKVILIPGPASGGVFDSTVNIKFGFDLGTGVNGRNTLNTWSTGTYYSFTGAISLIATGSATLDITGVQIEQDTAARQWDYRMLTIEEQLCARYFQNTQFDGAGWGQAGSPFTEFAPFRALMRAAPTVTLSAITNTNIGAITTTPLTTGVYLSTSITAAANYVIHAAVAADAELT